MSVAKNGHPVKVHYTGKLDDGSVFDSSEGRDPLAFTLGQGQMIPGFEQAVLGMALGEVREASIPSKEAYGERSDELLVEVPIAQVPADINPEIGMQLAINDGDKSRPVVVTAVEPDKIVLDANHPLAGKDLTFQIELVEIG
ncbi:MAG: peptidylprolyl isomerase [Imperialibacter sp.]|uniref:FKBP-type peptidyl-prolyl cis-trans isomerase n=1 Tax=Imperialibacter sp. TaxID=2038411 RepID=UPI0032EAC6E7